MLRQRTERFKSHLDTVPALSGVPALSRAVAWIVACVLIVGGVFYVTRGTSSQTMDPMFGGRELRDLELDQVELAFGSAGLTDWCREDGKMLTPKDTRHEYLAALGQSSALPYALKSSVEEAFGGGSYFESESQRRLRHEYAKARDLGHKIATFGDIAWASVDYDEQAGNGFDQLIIQSASVVLVSKNGKPIPLHRIEMIQNFVRASYAGMKADQVTVTDTSARKTYNGSDTPQTRQRRQAEYELEQRLTELLSGYSGLHIATKSVITRLKTSDSQPTGKSSTPTTPAEPVESQAEFVMRVSVGVPESQFHAQWINDYQSRNPGSSIAEAPTLEEMSSVRAKVVENIRNAIIPFVATTTSEDDPSIQVWSFPDSKETAPYLQTADRSVGLAAIVSLAKTHATIVIPIVCLLLVGVIFGFAAMRMRLRNSPLLPTPVAGKASVIDTESGSQSDAAVSAAQETTLRDDLAEMVESNPELAAQIVHSWIADAA